MKLPEQKKECMHWWTNDRFGMYNGHHRQGDIATEEDLNLRLPVNKPNFEIPVIELILYD